MDKPVEPSEYYRISHIKNLMNDTLEAVLDSCLELKKLFPTILDKEIIIDKTYQGVCLYVNCMKHNPNYEKELEKYNKDMEVYNQYIEKINFENEKKKQAEKDKQEFKNRKRQIRIAKRLIVEEFENKTIDLDNKKYKLVLVEEK